MTLARIIAIFLAMLLYACSSSPSDPASVKEEQAQQRERCRQLQQDIEDLKGRPIRRSAAREYYASECTNQMEAFHSAPN